MKGVRFVSRNEITELFSTSSISVMSRDTTNDPELKYLMNNLSCHTPYERPDAYLAHGDIVFCIEHFKISQYKHKKKGDIGQVAESSKQNRDQLKEDAIFNLQPSLNNLCDSLNKALEKHLRDPSIYKDNVAKVVKAKDYRLVLLIEDSSEQGAYVEKFDTTPRNPILFDKIAFNLLEYQNDIWGILLVCGNSIGKGLWGFTSDELEKLKYSGALLDIRKYRSMYSQETKFVAKNDAGKDSHHVTIELNDRFGLHD